MARSSMPKITWERFVEMLDALHSSVSDMSVEQLDALQYMRGYVAYNRKVSPAPSQTLLSLMLTYFPPSARSPSGASKALPTKQVKK